jgi:hypothetical protein
LGAKHEHLVVLLISGEAALAFEPGEDIELLPKPCNQTVLATKIREPLSRGVQWSRYYYERPMSIALTVTLT